MKKGFSLIELIVAMAIVTILATVAVPKVQIWNARNRGLKTVMEILSDFSKARSVAGYTIVSQEDSLQIPINSEIEDSEKMTVYMGVRSQTAIVFRKNEYGIYQKKSMATNDWGGAGSTLLKRNILAKNVSIEKVNQTMDPPANTTGFDALLIFTSNGKVKSTSGSIIDGVGSTSTDKCSDGKSSLNKLVLSAVIRSKISDSGADSIWYRLNIDKNGNYTICTDFTSNGSYNFAEKGNPLDGYL